jgi:hypothetical protein
LTNELRILLAKDGDRFKQFEKREEIRALLEINLLLTGYALENAIKGYLIYCYLKTNSIPAGSDLNFIKLNVWGKGNLHDLMRLFKHSDLILNDFEFALLEKLSKYVLWKGRYHIPKSYKDIKQVIKPGEGDRHTSRGKLVTEIILSKISDKIK